MRVRKHSPIGRTRVLTESTSTSGLDIKYKGRRHPFIIADRWFILSLPSADPKATPVMAWLKCGQWTTAAEVGWRQAWKDPQSEHEYLVLFPSNGRWFPARTVCNLGVAERTASGGVRRYSQRVYVTKTVHVKTAALGTRHQTWFVDIEADSHDEHSLTAETASRQVCPHPH